MKVNLIFTGIVPWQEKRLYEQAVRILEPVLQRGEIRLNLLWLEDRPVPEELRGLTDAEQFFGGIGKIGRLSAAGPADRIVQMIDCRAAHIPEGGHGCVDENAMISCMECFPADLHLIAGTEQGRRLGSLAAIKRGDSCFTGVQGIGAEGEGPGSLRIRRKVYSAHADAVFYADPGRTVAIAPVMSFGGGLCDAKLVFVGGRGLGNKQNYEQLKALAVRMGAACGCTRPAALNGWADYDSVIGVSGCSLSAELCVTFGVSGAAPFLYGIEQVRRVIAVNRDPDAPIFQRAQEGIAGDAVGLIDQLMALL